MENYGEWSLLNLLLKEIWIPDVFLCIRVVKWKWKGWSMIGSLMINSWVASYREKFFFFWMRELGSDTSCTNVIALHYNFGDGLVGAVARCWFFLLSFSIFVNLVTVW